MEIAWRITVQGLVQGVGFRPFVFLLARNAGIRGWVRNTNEGVDILALADKNTLSLFVRRIREEAPGASVIESIRRKRVRADEAGTFSIKGSEDLSSAITGISPDIAVCRSCLEDMERQPHRLSYPFINCTHCGPRYSIIRSMPYDRPNTSMGVFPMCGPCRSEYEDVEDRRFHAQPVACNHCGPEYTLHSANGEVRGLDAILSAVTGLLSEGKIIAIKGIGGYHLACDACNEEAVRELRTGKRREAKPFAVMFRDMESIREVAIAGKAEERALLSWQRPIVILKLKRRTIAGGVFRRVNSGLGTIGAVLPYMPFHYLLFRSYRGKAIVLTSGNKSSEPIVKDDRDAFNKFSGMADAWLVHNRDIVNRCDDSVVQVVRRAVRMIRRSRGYVPAPVHGRPDFSNIVACGAELSAGFCVGKGHQVIPGPFIGDLTTLATQDFFGETLGDFLRLFRISPQLIACDLHPGYYSTRFAESHRELPVIHVQHHHAHIASCMAEYGLDEKVIGVAFDGTGYGTDGKIWGAEFFVCELAGFSRVTHFDYIPLPGGDKAVEEPWRTAVAYLYRVFGRRFTEMGLPLTEGVREDHIRSVMNMIDNRVNCPEVSSAGRLFDAVAAILGLCSRSTFQAEAPMRLESLVKPGIKGTYACRTDKTIHVDPMIREIAGDFLSGIPVPVIATRFHNTIISIIFDTVMAIGKKEKLGKVVLSGGVFQNRYVLAGAERALRNAGMSVYSNKTVPVNDGGIALGQIAVAAKRRSMSCV